MPSLAPRVLSHPAGNGRGVAVAGMPLILLVLAATCLLAGCPMTTGGAVIKPEPAVTIR